VRWFESRFVVVVWFWLRRLRRLLWCWLSVFSGVLMVSG